MLNIEPLLLSIQNRRPVVIAAPLIAGLLLGWMFVVKPGLKQLNSIKSEIAGLQEKIPAYSFMLEGEKKIEENKKNLMGDRAWLTDQMNSVAEKTGVSILSSFPEEPTPIAEGLGRASMRIEAEAGYHQLGAFVSQLESLDRYVKIFGVDISAENMGAGQAAPGLVPRPTRGQITDLYKISVNVGIFTPMEPVVA